MILADIRGRFKTTFRGWFLNKSSFRQTRKFLKILLELQFYENKIFRHCLLYFFAEIMQSAIKSEPTYENLPSIHFSEEVFLLQRFQLFET